MATPNIHIGIIAGKLNGVIPAYRIDVDPRAGALGVFALEGMGDAAGIFDHLEAALDVAAGVGDHLAMLGGEEEGEILHVLFDQLLELEHHSGAALRVGRDPAGKRLAGGGDGPLEIGAAAETHPGLDAPIVGVEDVALALAGRIGAAADEMIDVTHGVVLE
jgi:hypothetical protein